jgi:hypothetical protein
VYRFFRHYQQGRQHHLVVLDEGEVDGGGKRPG